MFNRPISPMRVIGVYAVFLLSMGFPPLLPVSLPLMFWLHRGIIQRVSFVRRSRDYYLEEKALLDLGRLIGGRR